MNITIHKDVEMYNNTHKMIIAALHPEIQDRLKEYRDKYSLVLISRYCRFKINEWYLFIYFKDENGTSYRVDCQIH